MYATLQDSSFDAWRVARVPVFALSADRASRPDASTSLCASFVRVSKIYAPFNPQHPRCRSFKGCPTQVPERVVPRSNTAHCLVSFLRSCRGVDGRRCQRRFGSQGVSRKGREIHKSGLQVRAPPHLTHHVPHSLSLSLTWTYSRYARCRLDYQADFCGQSIVCNSHSSITLTVVYVVSGAHRR